MGTNKNNPSSWMVNDGSGLNTVYKGKEGWVSKRPDGSIEVLHCMDLDVSVDPPADPTISNIILPNSGTIYNNTGDVIKIIVRYDEGVEVSGNLTIGFTIGGTAVSFVYDSSNSDHSNLVFTYTTDGTSGDLADLASSITLDTNANIVAIDNGSSADINIPSSFAFDNVSVAS